MRKQSVFAGGLACPTNAQSSVIHLHFSISIRLLPQSFAAEDEADWGISRQNGLEWADSGVLWCAMCNPSAFFQYGEPALGFRKEIEFDSISSLQLRDAIVVHQFTVVRAAIAMMRDKSLGCAVIVDQSGKPIGLFTEQSVVEVLVSNASLDERPVCEFAERDFLCVKASEPIARVWDAVQRAGVRFVAVTDERGNLIGITGQRGIAEYISEYFPRQVVVQRLGSKPWMENREGA